MDATFARANPQKFIDYLSTGNKVLWHFINDPYWGYNIKAPPDWGWCGSVQANFFGSLTSDFKMLKFEDLRRLSFHVDDGDCHTVTWYNQILIDTMLNILVCDNKHYKLTDSPVVEPNQKLIDRYYKSRITSFKFHRIDYKINTHSGNFSPFLS